MDRSPLHQQIDSLPDLVTVMIDDLVRRTADLLPSSLCRELESVTVAGCGDSHHAAVNAEMAFGLLTGLPARSATAMQAGRYIIPQMNFRDAPGLVIAVSVSGVVSRTVEALDLAELAGATTLAVTGKSRSPLAEAGSYVLHTAVPPLPEELKGRIIPGARSYIASQLALYLIALQIGQARTFLSKKRADDLRRELAQMARKMEETIAACDPSAAFAAAEWIGAQSFIFLGSGPNLGTAQFSAAKLLEASGDIASGQDLEEWAHLEYFAREPTTPTFIISAAGRDEDRALEIAVAARAIGRRLALVAPVGSRLAQQADADVHFPLPAEIRECFSPLVAALPGLLFAAYHAQYSEAAYFRGFGGGRSAEGGGGVSRIRTSHRWLELPDDQ
jgi:glutamine---fructose-6-phosphate transaminase (isomerizing)